MCACAGLERVSLRRLRLGGEGAPPGAPQLESAGRARAEREPDPEAEEPERGHALPPLLPDVRRRGREEEGGREARRDNRGGAGRNSLQIGGSGGQDGGQGPTRSA